MKRKLAIIFLGLCFFILSLNAQAAWITKRLTYNSGYSEYPNIAVDSNDYLHVVWDDNTSGNFEIYYKKSTDGGATWTTKRLTYNSGYSTRSNITIDSNDHLHVVYDSTPGGPDIYYKRSTDSGATWTTKRLTYSDNNSSNPAIAVDSSNQIHVVWQDSSPGNFEIFYKRSTDSGTTWTTKRLTYNSGNSRSPSITVDSDNHLHVVWHDFTPGEPEIYYKSSIDGGANWTTKRLTYNPYASYFASIAVDSNNHLHVVWSDISPGNHEIYFKKSSDSGATWTTKRLTYNSGFSIYPDIAIDYSGNPHVVWQDDPIGSEIFYKWSTDGGSSWMTQRLTYNSGTSQHPTIAVDSNDHPHVVWEDDSPGNYEIYFKKK